MLYRLNYSRLSREERSQLNQSKIATNFKDTFDYLAYGQGPFTAPSGAEALAFVNTKSGEGKYSKKNIPSLDVTNEAKSSKIEEPDIELVFGIGSMAGDLSGTLRRIFSLPYSWVEKVVDNCIRLFFMHTLIASLFVQEHAV
ncbi:hypothetical protein KQX54_017593 [Cotesia glomerata]|uniref:Uncharacterized protein n=1 Tax=Cotesia glomerata TaxID=32391 RepID=A0AAV7IMS0_COTGL|nr:hypothetical protein KQX54_017593 [Cotesia glomerata]